MISVLRIKEFAHMERIYIFVSKHIVKKTKMYSLSLSIPTGCIIEIYWANQFTFIKVKKLLISCEIIFQS